MNKQELIDKWENKTGAPTFETRGVTERASNDDMYTFGYGVARKEILEDLKQLDEPQKPVVPKFVADWFEENKDDLEFAIWELCVDSYGSAEQGMLNWIQQSEKNPIETLIRMKDGYEVEKEPLYRVVINNRYLAKMSNFSDVVILVSEDEISECAIESYELTEKQIKAIDERYWPFAVPVEEEAEG
ncbi:TPA: DUF1642 domain-containing protein [Enterococcus faecium]